MAVRDEYVDTQVAAGKLTVGGFAVGAPVVAIPFTFEVAAADSDASIFRIAKNINPNLVPIKVEIFADVITGSTDWDLGFYEPLELGGAVIDKDCLADGIDPAGGEAHSAPLDGLVSIDLANVRKRIYEHAGQTLATKKLGYDLALTANTIGSGAGTVSGVFYAIDAG